ncbi:hypothetical protein E4U53_003395 [Claviceps sorghi]|nr:hypothetical protein E4U53_003395 [Claviceps sorghi]
MTSVGIIGAGHVGCALAFDMASRGHDTVIRALDGHPGNTGTIKANGGYLDATGLLTGRVRVRVGDGLAQLTESIIVVAIPSTGHEQLLEELGQHDLGSQTVILISGNAVALKAQTVLGDAAKAVLATATSPFSSRVSSDGSVGIRGIKKRLQICALRGAGEDEDKARLGINKVFAVPLVWSASALDMFLTGISAVLHVPTALMNVGWTETTGGDFFFYRQGMSPGVCRVMQAVDEERLAVAAAYGCPVDGALGFLNAAYGTRAASLGGFAAGSAAHNQTKGVQKRFVDQDVPFWLVLCADLGARAGVPTPAMDALVTLASTLSGRDHRETGITLRSLGLEDATPADVRRVLAAPRPSSCYSASSASSASSAPSPAAADSPSSSSS